MSVATTARAAVRSATRPATARVPAPRPPLRLVPQHRSSAARAPFVALVAGLLACGLLGLLLLNTVLAQDAFRLHALQAQTKDLSLREQALQRGVDDAQAPAELARRAVALGMVSAGPPVFLRLPDGAVLGEASPAPKPTAKPGAPAKASTAATAAAPAVTAGGQVSGAAAPRATPAATGPSGVASPPSGVAQRRPSASPSQDGTAATSAPRTGRPVATGGTR